MDKFFVSVKTNVLIAAVILTAAISWYSLCVKYHDSYWNGTIKRVQTVDFNILHHTMPITLSYLILCGRSDSIQHVLDSNYGIFGMVITDPKGENVIYKSEKVYKFKSWQNGFSKQTLADSQIGSEFEHFDWLTNPPPDHAQYANGSPRVTQDKQVAPPPEGQIIGRIYYLRQPPPGFWQDLVGAFGTSWFEMTGSKRGYILETLNVISCSLLITLVLLWRKQVQESKERELVILEKELAIKRRSLDTLTYDLANQRNRKEWLEHESQRAYQRAMHLKQSLQKLKEAFFFSDPRAGAVQGDQPEPISVRPPGSPPSSVIAEIEGLLPDLTNNAKILRSQAEVLQTYCAQLEMRQSEMQEVLDGSQGEARVTPAPAVAHLRSPFTPDQTNV